MTSRQATTTSTSYGPAGVTRYLLLAGTVAGPLFAVAAVLQAVLRDGFDPLRHAVSQLALGPGGWVQTTSFAVTGLLTIACATGLRHVLRGGRGQTWAPILLGAQGAGFVAAAAFPADPGNGFPPGAPTAPTFTTTGMLHLTCAGIAFLALIVATFVLARRFAADGRRGWAVTGRIAGVTLFLGFAAANTGATGGTLAMFIGSVVAWVWVGLSAGRLAGPTTTTR